MLFQGIVNMGTSENKIISDIVTAKVSLYGNVFVETDLLFTS